MWLKEIVGVDRFVNEKMLHRQSDNGHTKFVNLQYIFVMAANSYCQYFILHIFSIIQKFF